MPCSALSISLRNNKNPSPASKQLHPFVFCHQVQELNSQCLPRLAIHQCSSMSRVCLLLFVLIQFWSFVSAQTFPLPESKLRNRKTENVLHSRSSGAHVLLGVCLTFHSVELWGKRRKKDRLYQYCERIHFQTVECRY